MNRLFKKKTNKLGLKGILIVLLFLFTSLPWLNADGGLIPYYMYYNVYEPGQTVVIGWNGTDEVMILSTDVSLTGTGWVIELIPFPSLPGMPYAIEGEDPSAPITRVKEIIKQRTTITMRGDVDENYSVDIVDALLVAQFYINLPPVRTFNKFAGDMNTSNTVDILDALLIAQQYVGIITPTPTPGGSLTANPSPPSEITPEPTPVVIYHEITRVHDLTVVQAQTSNELINYAESLLAQKVSTADVSWDSFLAVADQYIVQEGIEYWCIDLLDIDQQVKQREPIVYNFTSDSLFFPLKISSINYGSTEINVYTISRNELDRNAIANVSFSVRNIDTFFDLTEAELVSINNDIFLLFNGPAKLAQLRYQGYLSSLTGDLKVKEQP